MVKPVVISRDDNFIGYIWFEEDGTAVAEGILPAAKLIEHIRETGGTLEDAIAALHEFAELKRLDYSKLYEFFARAIHHHDDYSLLDHGHDDIVEQHKADNRDRRQDIIALESSHQDLRKAHTNHLLNQHQNELEALRLHETAIKNVSERIHRLEEDRPVKAHSHGYTTPEEVNAIADSLLKRIQTMELIIISLQNENKELRARQFAATDHRHEDIDTAIQSLGNAERWQVVSEQDIKGKQRRIMERLL